MQIYFLILIYLNVVTHNFQLLKYMWMYLQISFFFPKYIYALLTSEMSAWQMDA